MGILRVARSGWVASLIGVSCFWAVVGCGSSGSGRSLEDDAGEREASADGGSEEPEPDVFGSRDGGNPEPEATGEAGSAGEGGESGEGGEGGSGGTAGAPSSGGAGGATVGGAGGSEGGGAGGGNEGGAGGNPPLANPENLITRLIDDLELGTTTEEWVANVTRDPLAQSQVVTPAGGTTSFIPNGDYSFAFIDRNPRAMFQHQTEFVFAEGDEPFVVEQQGFWPLVDGVGLVVSDVPLVKLFPPAASFLPERLPYPGQAGTDYRGASLERAIFAIYPDTATDSAEARLYFYADPVIATATPAYVNLLVDIDGDSVWEPDQGERLLENFALPSQSAGWTFTDPFPMPVDENNKFPLQVWTRLSVSEEPVPLDEGDADNYCNQGLSWRCTDEEYDFGSWSGGDCDSEYGLSGCTLTLGPSRENPPVPDIEGAESSYICQPDGVVIPTVTKGLILNLGDNPGDDWMEHGMNKAAASLSLRYGDEGVARLNYPTAERTLEAIRELMSGVQCLDEVHIIFYAHGYEGTGALQAVNGYGVITKEQIVAAVTESSGHCANPMNYAEADGCRGPGYCNLNFIFGSCYSGNMLTGETSLMLPGINVLTASSADSVGYGSRDGLEKGIRITHAFTQGFVNSAADATPYGDGDGNTTGAEAQRFAQATYDAGPDRIWETNPQLWQGADCNCICEANPCGNGQLDIGEECDPAAATSCSTNTFCNNECRCECSLSEQECAPLLFDPELCECVEPCGNGVLDPGESCDPFEATSNCPANYSCTGLCDCACTLDQEDCELGETLDPQTCLCAPTNHCPPVGGFTLADTFFTIFSDSSGHSPFDNVPPGPVNIPFTRSGNSFLTPGIPNQDIVPMSGSLVNDPLTGCAVIGSGSGNFAGFPNSSCQIMNGNIFADGFESGSPTYTFFGRYQCTPSGFPGQPITYDMDAFATVP